VIVTASSFPGRDPRPAALGKDTRKDAADGGDEDLEAVVVLQVPSDGVGGPSPALRREPRCELPPLSQRQPPKTRPLLLPGRQPSRHWLCLFPLDQVVEQAV